MNNKYKEAYPPCGIRILESKVLESRTMIVSPDLYKKLTNSEPINKDKKETNHDSI